MSPWTRSLRMGACNIYETLCNRNVIINDIRCDPHHPCALAFYAVLSTSQHQKRGQ